MSDRTRDFPLAGHYNPIVETSPIYQPELSKQAPFANIWPLKGQGPAAKKWLVADYPADAYQLPKHYWASPGLAALTLKAQNDPCRWERSQDHRANLRRNPFEQVTVCPHPSTPPRTTRTTPSRSSTSMTKTPV